MVRIRLRRVGKRHQPSYRVVVADSESPRDGRFIENIGFYNPRNDPATIEIDAERARYWLSVGAQPSEPVARLLRKIGVLGGGEAVGEQAVAEEQAEDAVAEDAVAEDAAAEDAVAEDAVAEDAEEAAPEEVEEETEEEVDEGAAVVAGAEPADEAQDAEAEAE
jgi:small subunit ribosomal protein S16